MTEDSNQEQPEQVETEPESSEDYRALLTAVRKQAGWRVAPRHLDVALQALGETGEEYTVPRIAEVVNAFQGERSQRQRKNADLWRLLGAQLAVRGKFSGPDAQQKFIGRAKALAAEGISDGDLLIVATALGSANHPLTPDITAEVTTWLIEQLGDDFDENALGDRLDQAVEVAMAARAEHAAKRRRRR